MIRTCQALRCISAQCKISRAAPPSAAAALGKEVIDIDQRVGRRLPGGSLLGRTMEWARAHEVRACRDEALEALSSLPSVPNLMEHVASDAQLLPLLQQVGCSRPPPD